MIHDYAPANRDTVADLLRRWRLPVSLARGDRDIVLPVRLAFGQTTKPGLNLETRSVYDLIEIAASTVEVPPEHTARGILDGGLDALAVQSMLRIRSAPERPADVLVAIRHRRRWFYIPADDVPSKLAFRFLQTLINMRLVESAPPTTPTLTIPIAK